MCCDSSCLHQVHRMLMGRLIQTIQDCQCLSQPQFGDYTLLSARGGCSNMSYHSLFWIWGNISSNYLFFFTIDVIKLLHDVLIFQQITYLPLSFPLPWQYKKCPYENMTIRLISFRKIGIRKESIGNENEEKWHSKE